MGRGSPVKIVGAAGCPVTHLGRWVAPSYCLSCSMNNSVGLVENLKTIQKSTALPAASTETFMSVILSASEPGMMVPVRLRKLPQLPWEYPQQCFSSVSMKMMAAFVFTIVANRRLQKAMKNLAFRKEENHRLKSLHCRKGFLVDNIIHFYYFNKCCRLYQVVKPEENRAENLPFSH